MYNTPPVSIHFYANNSLSVNTFPQGLLGGGTKQGQWKQISSHQVVLYYAQTGKTKGGVKIENHLWSHYTKTAPKLPAIITFAQDFKSFELQGIQYMVARSKKSTLASNPSFVGKSFTIPRYFAGISLKFNKQKKYKLTVFGHKSIKTITGRWEQILPNHLVLYPSEEHKKLKKMNIPHLSAIVTLPAIVSFTPDFRAFEMNQCHFKEHYTSKKK